MKRKSMVIAWMLTTACAVTQAQERITKYQVRDAIDVRTPILNDSINPKGEKYSTGMLLQTPIVNCLPEASVQTMATDSNGVLILSKPEKDFQFHILKSKIRAEKFMKGQLKVTSPIRWEVLVDGTSRQKKDQVEDSVSRSSTRSIPMVLEPEKDYDITIKLLASATDKATPSIKCEFVKDIAYKDIKCLLDVEAPRRFSLYNTEYGHRAASVSVSPNGRYLLTRYNNRFSNKRQYSYSELVDLKSGKILLKNTHNNLKWMPQSEKLYYTVLAADGFDVITLDPETLNEETIIHNLPEANFSWAPTEDFLIFYPREQGVNEVGPLKRIVSPADRIPGSRERSFLSKYDLKSGISERLTFGNHSTYIQDISSDGKYLVYSTSQEKITERPFRIGSMFMVELETMKIDTLFFNEVSLGGAMFSPDGKQLLITASPNSLGGIGKNCGKHTIANDFDTQAFILDLATRKIDPITKNFNPSVSPLQWNHADGCIYFNTDDGDCKNIYRYSPVEHQFEKLNLEMDVITSFTISKNNPKVAAYIGQSDHHAGASYLYDMKKNTSRVLSDPMAPVLNTLELGETQPWNFTASDGTLITGKICLPPNFDANKKYPLIVYYYGGTTPTIRGISNPYCAQLFASRDYVVYMIQPSGTIGFGQEFSARHVNAWGKRTADDIIEGTKQFCKEHPFVDEKRIGCLGASYGGFMTQYLQTQTDIFAAAVSHAGISDVTSYWGEGYWGYSYNAVAAADSYPWNNPQLFTQQGSLFNADKINTPLLLLHGTVDTNVPIGESIQIFNALKILGKPVELITVEGENHFIADYDKRVKWHNSIMAWFAKWLQDRPEWWNELYPKRHL